MTTRTPRKANIREAAARLVKSLEQPIRGTPATWVLHEISSARDELALALELEGSTEVAEEEIDHLQKQSDNYDAHNARLTRECERLRDALRGLRRHLDPDVECGCTWEPACAMYTLQVCRDALGNE